jgi:alkylated DNA repair dioxygenase AlkB
MQELFSNNDHNNNFKIDLPDADIVMYPNFFSPNECEKLLSEIKESTSWRQEKIRIYGREINLPRLTAWYGDEGKRYSYSGITVNPLKWTSVLIKIKSKIDLISGVTFNSVLLNYYRTGQDSISWHSDDEPELGEKPIIGSISLGAERPFQLRHTRGSYKNTIILNNGSYLLMKGDTQKYWQHQIPKTKKNVSERINLTFRIIGQ